MTPQEQSAIREAIAGIDNAMHWLEVEMDRLKRSLDAGISLEVIGAINAAVMKVKEGA